MVKILIVEDDSELQELFAIVLQNEGYEVSVAKDGLEAFDVLEMEHIDLVITDVMMPRMQGFELVQELRDSHYTMPVLIITAKDRMLDKKKGFQVGADDYMIKPIDVNEMVWRVEALLRRSQISTSHKIEVGNTEFNQETFTVSYGEECIELAQKEFQLLFKLASTPNKIFTRRQIMDEIWGLDSESDSHTLDVHMSRLREKFKGNEDFQIITVRGLGYKFKMNQEEQE